MLDVPGRFWLIDLPANGDNIGDEIEAEYNFDNWFRIFPLIFQSFNNPILVGQSFGGMFPLLFPELEDNLKGLVLFGAAPSEWRKAAEEAASRDGIKPMMNEVKEFFDNPNHAYHPSVLTR